MVTLGSDAVAVPLTLLHSFTDFPGIPEFFRLLLKFTVLDGQGGLESAV